jgi:hypothetical protein
MGCMGLPVLWIFNSPLIDGGNGLRFTRFNFVSFGMSIGHVLIVFHMSFLKFLCVVFVK